MVHRVDVTDEAGAGVAPRAVAVLVGRVMDAEGAEGTVAVGFIDETVMTDLNHRYRGEDGPTDVLSFAEEDLDEAWPVDPSAEDARSGHPGGEDEGRDLGEILVCAEVVRRYAEEEGNTQGRQMTWTIIHGVLHLLGHDHETDAGQMRERELILLEEIGDVDLGLPESDTD